MIPRLYRPRDDELIYHYCSPEAFHAICTNRTLRFGDLYAMNDYMERHWGYRIWEEAASSLLGSLGKPFLDKVDEVFHFSGLKSLILASCFSKRGDLLSQWRAYADNGTGYAIGFSAKDLSQLPTTSLEVVYDKDYQVSEMTSLIQKLHEIRQIDSITPKSDFKQICELININMAAYKNPGFLEEQEVRLIHMLNIIPTQHARKFESAGGTAFGKEVKGQKVQFRLIGENPSPFVAIDFSDEGTFNPIKQVVLGPKNLSIPTSIVLYLETIGLTGVKVSRSETSYQ